MVHEAAIRARLESLLTPVSGAGVVRRSRGLAAEDETLPAFFVGTDGQPTGTLIQFKTFRYDGLLERANPAEVYGYKIVYHHPAGTSGDTYDEVIATIAAMCAVLAGPRALAGAEGVLHTVHTGLEVIDAELMIQGDRWLVYAPEMALTVMWDQSC